MATNPFLGQWRIVWMDGWDQDYVDMEVPGHPYIHPGNDSAFRAIKQKWITA